MKLIITFIISMLSIFYSCTSQHNNSKKIDDSKISFQPKEEGEYDIIVLDPQYEIFLKTIARPKFFYEETYYKSKNRLFTTIWNQRFLNPFQHNPNVYTVSIDLDPTIEYGLDFEYKLYNFFKFMEWKYKIRFI